MHSFLRIVFLSFIMINFNSAFGDGAKPHKGTIANLCPNLSRVCQSGVESACIAASKVECKCTPDGNCSRGNDLTNPNENK